MFATLWLYTFLFWLYVAARIVFDHVPLNGLFLNYIPFFTFTGVGVIAFVLSMIFMYIFLVEKKN